MARFGNRGRVKRKKEKHYMPRYTLSVSDPKFEWLKPKLDAAGKPVLGDRLGQCILSYSMEDRDNDSRSYDVEVKLPVIAAWVSPSDGEVVKAHLTDYAPEVKKIGASYAEAKLFYEHLLFNAKIAYTNRENMMMIASSQHVMRYGRPAGHHYEDVESADGAYVHRKFYDSKALAIGAILNDIKRKNQRNIGGISTASFNDVPDDLLLQVGFIKVPDIMNRSVPMWMGDPSIVKDMESEASWAPAVKAKMKEMLETFLNGLQKALQS